MSDSNRYKDILGDIDCQSNNASDNLKCPLWTDEGPELDTNTGEYSCPLCHSPLGFQIDDSVQPIDDDPDDEDPTAQAPIVQEVDRKDWTDAQRSEIRMRRTMEELATVVAPYNPKLAYKLSETNFQYEVVNKFQSLRRNKLPIFTTTSFKSPLLAISLHLLSKEIPSKAYQEMRGVKVEVVRDMRRALALIDNPESNTNLENDFVMIGRKVDIPETIVSAALETFLEQRLPNQVDNPQTLVCAWLYLESKRMGRIVPKKEFYEKIGGVSATTLRKAIQSYTLALENVNISRDDEEDSGKSEYE